MIKRSLAIVVLLAITMLSFANDNQPLEMADTMRSSGKIYVVVAVLVTILVGLFLYLFRLDKKITELEKESKKA